MEGGGRQQFFFSFNSRRSHFEERRTKCTIPFFKYLLSLSRFTFRFAYILFFPFFHFFPFFFLPLFCPSRFSLVFRLDFFTVGSPPPPPCHRPDYATFVNLPVVHLILIKSNDHQFSPGCHLSLMAFSALLVLGHLIMFLSGDSHVSGTTPSSSRSASRHTTLLHMAFYYVTVTINKHVYAVTFIFFCTSYLSPRRLHQLINSITMITSSPLHSSSLQYRNPQSDSGDLIRISAFICTLTHVLVGEMSFCSIFQHCVAKEKTHIPHYVVRVQPYVEFAVSKLSFFQLLSLA